MKLPVAFNTVQHIFYSLNFSVGSQQGVLDRVMADIGEPYLNCKAFTLAIDDENITKALKFCTDEINQNKKKNKKKNNDVSKCISIRQVDVEHEKKDRTQNEKRLAWNVEHHMMQQREFYREIEREVLNTVKKVQKAVDKDATEELEVKQFTVLFSRRGCKKQVHHFENVHDPQYKRYYINLSLMEGTSVSVKIFGNEGIEHTIGLSPKSMVLFNDKCYHAGGEYKKKSNYRFYFMVAPKDMPKEGLKNNSIQLGFDSGKGVLCSYCLEERIKSKEVPKDRKKARAFYDHYIKCKQYWMIEKEMSEDEAEIEALYWIGKKMERNEKSNAKRKKKKEEAKEQERKRKHSNTVE